MKFFAIFSGFLIFLAVSSPINAIVDPLAVTNNKYGIHITDENDFVPAAKLVNSSGGDWGYVTLVIADDDRNIDKWQNRLDMMRALHLIPIIRLATHPTGDMWSKPDPQDAKSWADFLSKLYWISKNRYIVIFNEPNHAAEWGGNVNPSEYAKVLAAFSQNLHAVSPDFFVLPAGLDASAPNSTTTMDEVNFVSQMISTDPAVFSYIDGWTSHSYPNPDFRGKTTDEGRGTLRTYLWELDLLKELGQSAKLPVFITETGWPHMEGFPENKTYYTADQIPEFIQNAAKTVWNDPQIVAITPFILNYQSYPFTNFSWKKLNADNFFSYYDTYQTLPKTSGKPVLYSVLGNFAPIDLSNLSSKYSSDIPRINIFFWRSLFYGLFKL